MPLLTDDAIRLGDGRTLAYAEWGEPQGRCVFLFHGTPHSRLFCPDEAVTASSNVRLVTVDRPGIGGSDVLPRRTLGDWPSDVVELADALEIEKFGVVGWSANCSLVSTSWATGARSFRLGLSTSPVNRTRPKARVEGEAHPRLRRLRPQ